MANVALMVNLNPMTWVRFGIWMSIGNTRTIAGVIYILRAFNVSRLRDLLCVWNAPQQGKYSSHLLFWFTEIQFSHRRVGIYSGGQRSAKFTDFSDGKLKNTNARAYIPSTRFCFRCIKEIRFLKSIKSPFTIVLLALDKNKEKWPQYTNYVCNPL